MKLFLVACACQLAFAQAPGAGQPVETTEAYAGPGVLSDDASDVGNKSGREMDLRLFGGVNGIYDTGLLPFSVDTNGNLTDIGGLFGVEARFGAYGSHNWRRAKLGLNYTGGYRHYTNRGGLDGSDHSLTLGYSRQQSRRVSYDFSQTLGTFNRSLGIRTVGGSGGIEVTPANQFLDSRTTFGRTALDVLIKQSARTYYTVGGNGYFSNYKQRGLADLRGYGVEGSVGRRVNQFRTLGARYAFGIQKIPLFSMTTNTHTVEGTYDAQFGLLWSLSIRAGVMMTHVDAVQNITLDPIIAAILGTPGLTIRTDVRNTFPSGSMKLQRRFKLAVLGFDYNRSMSAGNGLIAAARLESGRAGLSYTGVRHLNFGVDTGYYAIRGLTQNFGSSKTFSGGGGVTMDLPYSLHLNFRYDARHIDVDAANNIRRDASRVTFGLFFSPGEIPLSLW